MLSYIIPASNCDYYCQSFLPRTISDWNILPQDVVQLGTVEAFKNAIPSYLPPMDNEYQVMGTPLYSVVNGHSELEDNMVIFF